MSGVLHGIAGMSGPPLVLTLLAMKTDKLTQRSTLVTYFFFIGAFAVTYYQFAVGFTWHEVVMGLVLLPGLMLGIECGVAIFRRTQSGVFKTATLFMLLALGFAAIVRGLAGLIA